jgi:hypothetical protein
LWKIILQERRKILVGTYGKKGKGTFQKIYNVRDEEISPTEEKEHTKPVKNNATQRADRQKRNYRMENTPNFVEPKRNLPQKQEEEQDKEMRDIGGWMNHFIDNENRKKVLATEPMEVDNNDKPPKGKSTSRGTTMHRDMMTDTPKQSKGINTDKINSKTKGTSTEKHKMKNQHTMTNDIVKSTDQATNTTAKKIPIVRLTQMTLSIEDAKQTLINTLRAQLLALTDSVDRMTVSDDGTTPENIRGLIENIHGISEETFKDTERVLQDKFNLITQDIIERVEQNPQSHEKQLLDDAVKEPMEYVAHILRDIRETTDNLYEQYQHGIINPTSLERTKARLETIDQTAQDYSVSDSISIPMGNSSLAAADSATPSTTAADSYLDFHNLHALDKLKYMTYHHPKTFTQPPETLSNTSEGTQQLPPVNIEPEILHDTNPPVILHDASSSTWRYEPNYSTNTELYNPYEGTTQVVTPVYETPIQVPSAQPQTVININTGIPPPTASTTAQDKGLSFADNYDKQKYVLKAKTARPLTRPSPLRKMKESSRSQMPPKIPKCKYIKCFIQHQYQ